MTDRRGRMRRRRTGASMTKVVLVTAHYLHSRRKAGFHWLAEAFWKAGYDVLFLTESLSWISWLRGNDRFQYDIRRAANRIEQVRDRLASFVWLTRWHPFNLRLSWLNQLSGPFMRRYGRLPLHGIEPILQQADLLVFDSTYGLMLFDRMRELCPRARFVYRVSDDIPLMNNHPVLLETETHVAPQFDLVSVPSAYIRRRLCHLPQVALHYHGVQTEAFDRITPNPYHGSGAHAVFVGQKFLDCAVLERASRLLPHWDFDVIGPFRGPAGAANVHAHGELAFADTVPYLQHADVGMQMLTPIAGVEVFSDSLKMQQYTYCRLPIVAPAALASPRPHVIAYQPDNDCSIRAAFEAALAFDRRRVPRDSVLSWDVLASLLAGPVAGALPRRQTG
jgi:2-beta-glucuronyltransferase